MIAREIKREPKKVLAPFFAWSLTLVSLSLLLNRTETLATQAMTWPCTPALTLAKERPCQDGEKSSGCLFFVVKAHVNNSYFRKIIYNS